MKYRKYKGTKAICESCGDIYQPKVSSQKYCSSKCARQGQLYYRNRELKEKTCAFCGTYFNTYKKMQKYCSEECYKKANRAAMTQYRKKMGTTPYLKIRFSVFERDRFRCRYCGRGPDDGVKLVVDHIVPKNKRGEDELSNYITACSECNAGKMDILLLANKKGQGNYPLT